jgi:hypothetical protein
VLAVSFKYLRAVLYRCSNSEMEREREREGGEGGRETDLTFKLD